VANPDGTESPAVAGQRGPPTISSEPTAAMVCPERGGVFGRPEIVQSGELRSGSRTARSCPGRANDRPDDRDAYRVTLRHIATSFSRPSSPRLSAL
jgi:hypothetical protein